MELHCTRVEEREKSKVESQELKVEEKIKTTQRRSGDAE